MLPSRPHEAVSEALSGKDIQMSRRRMIGLSGLAVVGASPLLKGAQAALSGQFEMKGDERRLAFSLGGAERWVIDLDRFAGKPSLEIDRNDRRILLTLKNARRPGTDIPLDFECEIRRGATGARINFSADFGQFKGKGSFEKWLLGLESLRSTVRFGQELCQLGSAGNVALQGKGRASFWPDWSLNVEGEDILRLRGLSSTSLRADRFSLGLPEENLPAIVEKPAELRSIITVERGEQDWKIVPEVKEGKGWQLNTSLNVFDSLLVEAEEGKGGERSVALLAERSGSGQSSGSGQVEFVPAGSLKKSNGHSFALPLENPRYAVEFGRQENTTLLLADYPEKPVSMRTDGLSLKVGRGSGTDPFELSGRGSEVEGMVCAPEIIAASLPLRGAVVQPAKPRRRTRLHFFREKDGLEKMPTGALRPGLPDIPDLPDPDDEDEGDVMLDEEKETVVTFPLSSVIWVLRPADMLYLGFEFINLQIKTGGGSKGKTKGYQLNNTELVATQQTASINVIAAEPVSNQISKVKGPGTITSTGNTTTNLPYLVVHFPPQNIAERAYWEADDAQEAAKNDPNNSDQIPENMEEPAGGNETPDLPPIEHRIAGPSRLAFKLPSGMTQLPYTLADLLDWSSLTPSVVPSAVPPPPPPSPAIGSILGLSEALKGKISNVYTGGKAKSISRIAAPDGGRTTTTTGRAKYSNITLKRGYIASSSAGQGNGTQAIDARSKVMADNPSIQADPGQMAAMKTENPAAKFDLYLNLTSVIPKIIKPKEYHTAIEAPYRLILSPHVYSGWAHSLKPVTHNGRTELWHTRLGVRKSTGAIDEHDDYYRTVRAVWSPDFQENPTPGPASTNTPFRMSLNARDRHELVHLSANFQYPVGDKKKNNPPEPVGVDSLMLSALGAWMNTRGTWEPPPDTSIEEWRHRGTMGRDHYVRVVYKGFLFPFGNRAALIKITERKIKKFGRHGYIAYMYQRMYIVVRKPVMEYPALSQPYSGRRTPFRTMRLTTLITPNLDQPDQGISKIGSYGDEAFWPVVDGEDFLFNVVAEDWDGNQIEFSTPLAFVNNKKAFDYSVTQAVLGTYNANRNTRDVYGQTIAYAPSEKTGDTAFETDYVQFTADVPTSNTGSSDDPGSLPKVAAGTGSTNNRNNDDLYNADQPYFYPAFVETRVRIDAVEQITGTAAFQAIELHDTYYKHGIDGNANKGQVFAKLKDAVEMSFNTNADKAGGLGTPNMNIAGLSRSLGTVGGKIEEVTSGKFDPTSFFDEALDANLLGGISLRDIIDAVNDFAGDLIKIPRMLNSKNFSDPKQLVSTIQDLMSAVNDVKDDIDKFKDMKDDLQEVLDDIESIPEVAENLAKNAKEEAEEAAKNAAEAVRQKALAVIQQVEKEAKGIIEQAKGYAESLINKVKNIAESESLADLLEQFGLPTELTLELKWGPTIKSWPNSNQSNDLMGTNALFQTLNAAGQEVEVSNEVVYIRAALTVKLDGSPPTFSLEGVANNFKIKLIPIDDAAPDGFVHLRMSDLSFRSKDGSKVEVNVEFDPDTGITFHGPLAFVEKIREFIPFDGFSDPPSLDVTPTGIIAGFTFPIPSIAVGVFSLQNISLGASLELPFTNSPLTFTFLFCTRENPFVLTVSMLGGGGFFGLIISTKEIGFEAALEFGAQIAFDVGVASGGVYVKAGVYYKKMGEEVILEGYLKLGGHLSVLGIISISIDLYLSLTYKEPGGKVIGQATLTFEVEVLFFSISFSKTIERRFKGSENDPLFIDLMSQSNWDEYCAAFG